VATVQAGTMEERRKDERIRCSAPVEVAWQDRDGRSRHAKAQLVDVSAGGLSFLLNEKIAVNTPVRIHYAKNNLDGQTRYWTSDILGWVVGVQLEHRFEWGPMIVASSSHGHSEWPVGRVRPRRRFSTLVRDFLGRLGRLGRSEG